MSTQSNWQPGGVTKAGALQPTAKPSLFAAREGIFFDFLRYSELDLRQDTPLWLYLLSASTVNPKTTLGAHMS